MPPEVNRILYVKNLPYKISNDEMYKIFGRYGAIRQIRKGVTDKTKGTAYVIYEDIYEAKAALEALSGYNILGRYVVVLYFQKEKLIKQINDAKEREKVRQLKEKLLKKEKEKREKERKKMFE